MRLNRIFGLCAVCALLLSSCGNDNMFGGIPNIYQDAFIAASKDNEGSFSKVIEEGVKVGKEKATPIAEKLIGKSIPYKVMDENLPYKIISDIVIKNVELPSALNITDRGRTGLLVEFDVEVGKIEGEIGQVNCFYLLPGKDGYVGFGQWGITDDQMRRPKQVTYYGLRQTIYVLEEGDKLHVKGWLYAPAVPAEYLDGCNELHLVSNDTFNDHLEKIKDKQKTWYYDFAKIQGW
ncbi:hypothetical protein [uncultured Bacteroides sp.]|uniref:hypothetical protein n=1 Tax=uncultured Bacteroides sp. TaxID=162156 RepID=UPI0026263263|nr:hypothetical protein [uncultured Bacteroides sp.]